MLNYEDIVSIYAHNNAFIGAAGINNNAIVSSSKEKIASSSPMVHLSTSIRSLSISAEPAVSAPSTIPKISSDASNTRSRYHKSTLCYRT